MKKKLIELIKLYKSVEDSPSPATKTGNPVVDYYNQGWFSSKRDMAFSIRNQLEQILEEYENA